MIGQVVLGRYEVFALLHEAGLSQAYLALDTVAGRTVVLQLLHEKLRAEPRFADIFKRETDRLGRFHHPHATALLEANYNSPEGPCLVFENAKGTSLAELLSAGQRYDPLQVGLWLGQIGSALHHAYTLGILHRDLNPSNIVLVNAGLEAEAIKIKNLGLSQLTTAPHLALEAFHGSARPVTAMPEYMCPEQGLGEEMDQRGDIYSLGVILFQLLAGRHPFPCKTAEEYREAHAHTVPPKFAALGIDDVPPAIEEVVQHCLSKYNAWRPFDAQQLVQQFERALGEPIAVEAPSTGPAAAVSPESSRVLPPDVVNYRLEAWMPEAIAVVKLQGFVERVRGKVFESLPGSIRIRLPHPQSPPPPKAKSGIFQLFGQTKAPEPAPWVIELEVHMEKKDPTRPNLLDVALLFRSPNEVLAKNRDAVRHCDELCKEICSFLMAKPIES